MSNEAVALIGFVSLFALMLLRVPVGMAMGLVGITGFGYLTGFAPALKLVGQTTMRTVTDYSFGVIPMFLLMGAFVSVSGISRELFRAANTFVGHWKGGLGIATIAACGGFAAISGSSVATAATSYRGTHITVDLVWANVGPRTQRWIDVFATLVLLFVVSVQTYTLFDKVRGTYNDHVLTFDMHMPTWPFFAVAWVGDISAVLLIAIRTYRLIFHPEDMHDTKLKATE